MSSVDTFDTFEGEQQENFQPAVWICLANLFVFCVGEVFGWVDLLGLTAFASVGLMLATYLCWEFRRPRSAGFCALGTLPLWVLLMLAA
jgi:hypothetical protein